MNKIRERENINISPMNSNLTDIFNEDYYLELGNISYEVIARLLKKELVSVDEVADYKIQNIGVGHASEKTLDLQNILPYIYFENIQNKERSIQLFITCGVLRKKQSKSLEKFSPIVLLQVKLLFIYNKYYLQLNGRPIENTVLFNGLTRDEFAMSSDRQMAKLDTIYDIDSFCMQFSKLDNYELILENYLTFAITTAPAIVINHDHFSLSNNYASYLGNKCYLPGKDEVYNITRLNNKQRLAINRVNDGDSFAISGIIGTGKTTALMNIASDAITRGKNVLYVSNSTDTTKYVSDTYRNLGLGGLVADLTDPILGSSIDFKNKDKEIVDIDDVKNKLSIAYKSIDEYEKVLTGRALGYRFVDIIQEILDLKPVDKKDDIDSVNNIYKHEAEEIIDALEHIEELKKNLRSPSESIFTNIPIENDIKYADIPISIVSQLHDLYEDCLANKIELEEKYGFNDIVNYARFKNVTNDIRKMNILEIPDSWLVDGQKYFFEAKDKYNEFKAKVYKIKETKLIIDWEFANIDTININDLIKGITGEYFTRKDIDKINYVLKNRKSLIALSEEMVGLINNIKEYQKNFNRSNSSSLRFDSNWIRELIGFSQFINENYFYNKWLNTNRSQAILVQINKLESLLNAYENTKLEYLNVFHSLKDIDVNLKKMKKAIANNKTIANYHKDELVDFSNRVKKYLIDTTNIDKVYSEYKSIVGVDFELGFNASEKFEDCYDYITSIKNDTLRRGAIKILVSNNQEYINRVAKEAKDVVAKIDIVLTGFDKLVGVLGLPKEYNQITLDYYEIMSVIIDINNYLHRVDKINDIMKNISKDQNEYISFDIYLRLKSLLNEQRKAEQDLNTSEDYKMLYGMFYEGGQTKINDVALLISTFQNYIDCFKTPLDVERSLDITINNEINTILMHVNSLIFDINDAFNVYNKIFKEGIGEYYYGDISDVITYWETMLGKEDELVTYLDFTKYIQVLLKNKLFRLSRMIINGEVEDTCNLFKNHYYKTIFKNYLKDNNELSDGKTIENILEDIIKLEDLYAINNVNNLSDKIEIRNDRLIKLRYERYIQKNLDSKWLFLADVKTVNKFIDCNVFDLVLIDDAHLLAADDYDNLINASQVILAGEESYRLSNSSGILTRIRNDSTMDLTYRYIATPANIIQRLKHVHGVIKPDVNNDATIEVIQDDDATYIYKLIRENPDVTINYYTSLLHVQKRLYNRLTALLVKTKMPREKIIHILRKQINICDLGLGVFNDAFYNIINYDDYGKDFDRDFLAWASNVLVCKKKIVILSKNKELSLSKELKTFNKEFFEKYINIESSTFNKDISPCLGGIKEFLIDNGYSCIGSYGDISLVVKKDNKYCCILLFANPSSSHFDILSDYRDYYTSLKDNNVSTAIVWLYDLVNDFSKTCDKLLSDLEGNKDEQAN